MATVDFLCLHHPRATPFVIGERGLVSALHHAGYGIPITQPDGVNVGEGPHLNDEMTGKAMTGVLNGVHPITFPTPLRSPRPLRPLR